MSQVKQQMLGLKHVSSEKQMLGLKHVLCMHSRLFSQRMTAVHCVPVRTMCMSMQDAPMLAELAMALRGVGKHAEAERCCTAAVNARPDCQRGWLELARCQAAQGCCLNAYLYVISACSCVWSVVCPIDAGGWFPSEHRETATSTTGTNNRADTLVRM